MRSTCNVGFNLDKKTHGYAVGGSYDSHDLKALTKVGIIFLSISAIGLVYISCGLCKLSALNTENSNSNPNPNSNPNLNSNSDFLPQILPIQPSAPPMSTPAPISIMPMPIQTQPSAPPMPMPLNSNISDYVIIDAQNITVLDDNNDYTCGNKHSNIFAIVVDNV